MKASGKQSLLVSCTAYSASLKIVAICVIIHMTVLATTEISICMRESILMEGCQLSPSGVRNRNEGHQHCKWKCLVQSSINEIILVFFIVKTYDGFRNIDQVMSVGVLEILLCWTRMFIWGNFRKARKRQFPSLFAEFSCSSYSICFENLTCWEACRPVGLRSMKKSMRRISIW